MPLLRRNVLKPTVTDGGVVDIYGHTWEKLTCTGDCTQHAKEMEKALRNAIPDDEARRVQIQSSRVSPEHDIRIEDTYVGEDVAPWLRYSTLQLRYQGHSAVTSANPGFVYLRSSAEHGEWAPHGTVGTVVRA